MLPVVQGYNLHPSFDVKADGLLESLRMAFNVKSEAGHASGNVVADFKAPDIGVARRRQPDRTSTSRRS